jgi:DNA (cytosine-5)-methyltransferase 1
MSLSYIDVCSGISAPTRAWKPLGWRALCYAEIDAAPRAVLKHHYPDVPLVGDFTKIEGNEHGAADLIVGGTPCQSFSIAGLRKGMDDDRGNLALEYIRLAQRARTPWVVWENVPGVFTSSGGEDFRCFLAGLAGWDVPLPDGGWQNSGIVEAAPLDASGGALTWGLAWRVLDAQHFGVPQRRRRVFVVGYLGDWRRAAAVLFERHSMSGDSPPRREPRKDASANPGEGTDGSSLVEAFGGNNTGGAINVAACLNAKSTMRGDFESETLIVCFSSKDHGADASDIAPTLRSGAHSESHANAGAPPAIAFGETVRRLTPRECERLQGFPDEFTLVPYRKGMMADGPRYKMLGNSMAVPVLAWIGARIQAVEDALAGLRLVA